MPVECNSNKRAKTIYPDKNNNEKLSDKEYMSCIREDFNQAIALGYEIFKNKTHAWTIQKHLLKDLHKEQEKFKYLNPDVEDIRYFLEEYKPKSADPNITCFKELTMQGYQIKSKSFSISLLNRSILLFSSYQAKNLSKAKPSSLTSGDKSLPCISKRLFSFTKPSKFLLRLSQ